jgi:hypothetical protein
MEIIQAGVISINIMIDKYFMNNLKYKLQITAANVIV